MKILKTKIQIIIAIIMIVGLGMFTSCDQERDLVNGNKDKMQDELSSLAMRAGYNPSYDFYEGPLNSKVVKSPGYVYQWKITDYSETLFYPKVQFDGPDGTTTYINMVKVGSSWILNKDLIKNGRYYWRYLDNSGNPLTSWNSYVDNIKITTGNDYPYPTGQCVPNTSGCTDQWSFYKYNCTSWVSWKVNQMWGTTTSFRNNMTSPALSNAVNWRSRLQSMGYYYNNNPIVGSIAYWGAYASGGIGVNGHVAFVIGVTRNSSDVVTSILISEYNGSSSFAYGTRTLTPGSVGYPTSFIHVQYRL